jgi:hypothetical protein
MEYKKKRELLLCNLQLACMNARDGELFLLLEVAGILILSSYSGLEVSEELKGSNLYLLESISPSKTRATSISV